MIKQTSTSKVFHGVGRRKSSVARVWLQPSTTSDFKINDKKAEQYFKTELEFSNVNLPLKLISNDQEFIINVSVFGGGTTGQSDAVRLGIARALLSLNETWKGIFRQNKLITVDDRIKERKKYGQKAARRKFQFVKR